MLNIRKCHRSSIVTVISMFFLLNTGLAFGQDEETSTPMKIDFGLRTGWDIDNEQFLFGVQSEFKNVIKPFTVAPSFDYGTGNDLTTFAFNGDMKLDLVSLPGSITNVYIGAGPTLIVWDRSSINNDTEVGITFSAGLKFRLGNTSRYNIEARIGTGDIPETRLMFGILL